MTDRWLQLGGAATTLIPMQIDGDVPEHVLEAFGVSGADIELLSGGRTNRTMRVRAGYDLVLQHLRAGGPSDLLQVMENLVRVTSHLEWQHAIGGDRGEPRWWPQLVPTVAGKPYVMDEQGDVWRAYLYTEGRVARAVQPPAVLESAARLFGRFSHSTNDLDGPPLAISTPGFHDLDMVWQAFEVEREHASADTERRGAVERLAGDLALVEATRRRIEERCAADGLDLVRTRVVHNDTKMSNVLLHPVEPRATAVIDLDLVMMGPLWHDIGDLVRSASWHTATSPPAFGEHQTVRMLRAFISAAGPAVGDDEIATFAAAGPRLSFELGVRYLTDHLRSEPHLQVEGEDGHRRRGRANVRLAAEMLNAYDALRPATDELIARR